ncbi:MAG: hypothetical protein ACE5DS_05745, partial [Kiloniellaceae bacterium]
MTQDGQPAPSVGAALLLALATALASASLAAAPAAPAAPVTDPAQAYAQCMAQARAQPEAALQRANAWMRADGGGPAAHCAAVALIGLGRTVEAAQRLEQLAQDTPDD